MTVAGYLLGSLLTLLMQDSIFVKIKDAMEKFSYEPTCNEVVQKTIQVIKKNKKAKVPSSKTIHLSALLPTVSLQLGKNLGYDETMNLMDETNATLKIYSSDDLKFKVTVEWNLSSLVFDPSEIQASARAQSEENFYIQIKKEIIEIYYTRKKFLALLYVLGESISQETIVDWKIKIDELTSLLDSYTENWFSNESQKRKNKKK